MKRLWLFRTLAISVLVSMVIGVAGCAESNSSSTPDTSKTTEASETTTQEAAGGNATLWTWDVPSEEAVVEAFEAANPGYTVEVVAVGYDDYMNKIQTSIASGSELADILMGELGFRAKLFDLDILDNLEEAPYNFDPNSILDYSKNIVSYDGKIVSLDQSITAGGLAYKKKLANEYLGLDSVEAMEGQLDNWDAMVDAAIKVQEESNGEVFLFHSWADIQEYFDCFGDEPWTVDNKPTEYLLETMPNQRYDILVRMMEANGFDKSVSDHYTPAMNAAIDGSNHMMLNAATWTSQFVITPNDPDGQGKWALMEAPGGAYVMGGTSIGVWEDSENKDAAWKYIQWAFATQEGGEANVAARNYSPPYKEFVDSFDYSKIVDPMFEPQNIAEKFYVELAPSLKIRAPEVYMNQMKSAFKVAENAVILDGPDAISLEKYKEILVQEIKNNCPDLVFD